MPTVTIAHENREVTVIEVREVVVATEDRDVAIVDVRTVTVL